MSRWGWREMAAYAATVLMLVGIADARGAIACADGNCNGPRAGVVAP